MFLVSLPLVRACSRAASTIFLVGATLVAGRAEASVVTITVKGTVDQGTDTTGVFGLGALAILNGQKFSLVYTFDDTKGQPVVQQNPGESAPCGSYLQSFAESNPGTAVLQIGNGSWTFGQQGGPLTNSITGRVVGMCSGMPGTTLGGDSFEGVFSQIMDGNISPIGSDLLKTTFWVPAGTYPATAYNWEDALTLSQFLARGANTDNFFSLETVNPSSGSLQPTNEASGFFTPSSITITSSASAPASTALQFIPITPCRVADTRNPAGPFGGPELAGGTTREFDIPKSACSIPASATAYSLNVTVVPNRSLGYLTIWPAGQPQPATSSLNSDGRNKANAAIVPAGTNGGVNVFVSDPSQVILDIAGYFAPAGTSSALSFYPLTPCRLVDTRSPAGPLGGPTLVAGTSREFPIRSACNLPSDAAAYSLNVTAVPQGPLPYLTAWPSGQSQPTVSTLNAPTGTVTANGAIVPAGSNGDVSVYVAGTSDVVIDVNGYFATPGAGGLSLYTMTPCRVIDTRNGTGAFAGVFSVDIESSSCAPPSTAQAYVVNATVVPSNSLGYLTLWPAGQTQPQVSTLNAYDGVITSNTAVVPTVNGSINTFAANPTQLILDLFGYYAP
jgi:hypothetical protein